MATPGYQPRVRVNVGRADPALGPQTAIADGVRELGGAVGQVADDRRELAEAQAASQYRIDAEQQRRDRSAMIADRAGALAVVQGKIADQLDEARKAVPAGAPGWRDTAQKIVDDNMTTFLDTLGDDDEVRQRFEPLVVNYGVSTIGRENDWGTAKKIEHEGNSLKAWHDQRTLQVEERGDLQAAFDEYDVLLDGMDMDDTTRQKLRLSGKQEFVERTLSAQIAGGNAAAVQQALAVPQIKTDVKPQVAGTINIFDRPVVQNADGTVSTVRTISFGTDEGEVLVPTIADDGTVMTDDEAIARYNETGQHLGIFKTPAEATKYAKALHDQQEALTKSPARSIVKYLTPESRGRLFGEAERAQARAVAEAERAASEQRDAARQTVKTVQALIDSGAEPTAAQLKQMKAASALLPPDEQIEVAAIDTALAVNRATRGQSSDVIRREHDRLRAKADSGRASQTEQMMLKSYATRLDAAEDSEADTLKGMMGQGAAGRVAVVEQTQGMDAASRFAVLEKASPGLGHVGLLRTPANRMMAIEGAEIRKSQADLVPDKEAKAAFRQSLGSVAGLIGEQYDDKLDVAMNLYAHHVSRSPQKAFNPGLFWQYTNIAFGATKRRDGTWQGGLGTVNGVRTVLPDNVSDGELRASIARTDWSNARDASGNPVAKSFITGQMFPVLVDEGPQGSVYHLRDRSGRELLGPNGGALRWSVANGVGR